MKSRQRMTFQMHSHEHIWNAMLFYNIALTLNYSPLAPIH